MSYENLKGRPRVPNPHDIKLRINKKSWVRLQQIAKEESWKYGRNITASAIIRFCVACYLKDYEEGQL